MKLTLKAPGSKRLKLKSDKLLSNVAFKFNLRRYMVVNKMDDTTVQWSKAGAYTRSLFSST